MQTIPNPSVAIRSGYLLVDPSNMDDETFCDAIPMVPCTPVSLSQSAHLMPRLIDVAALSTEQQDSLVEVLLRELNGERPPVVCAWLAGPPGIAGLDVQGLARHIRRYLIGRTPDGTTVFWRYFDPRVFSVVMSTHSPEQIQALLGPVREWRFPWCGRWWRVLGTGQEADVILGHRPAWPDETQWRNVENSAMIASVLATLQSRRTPGERFEDAECLRIQRTVDKSIQNARQHLHLDDHSDLTEYAFHCARYGDEFRTHPKLNAEWGELAQRQKSWSDFISKLDQADYRVLDQDCLALANLRRSEL